MHSLCQNIQICFQKHFSNDVFTSEGDEAGLSHSGNTQISYSYHIVGTLASILCCSVFSVMYWPFFYSALCIAALEKTYFVCQTQKKWSDQSCRFYLFIYFWQQMPCIWMAFTPTAHLSWFNVGQPLFCIRAFCKRTCRIYLQNNKIDGKK